MNRRTLLKSGLAAAGFATLHTTTPDWIIRSARTLIDCLPEDRILIILQHAGGIDGLNTVVPFEDPAYYAARPVLAVPPGAGLDIGDDLNRFHPRLPNLARRFRAGSVAVIQNVGYPNPNLSHFGSTDFYEFARAPGDPLQSQGWLSRFHDNACSGAGSPMPLDMLTSGVGDVPTAMFGSDIYTAPSFAMPSEGLFFIEGLPDVRALTEEAIFELNALPTTNSDIDFVQRSVTLTGAAFELIAEAAMQPVLEAYPTQGPLGPSTLADGLKLASQVIRAPDIGTRIFYVRQKGYDNHANQIDPTNPLVEGGHPELLAEFDQALEAFLKEMEFAGLLERILIMSFSEFGRRVAQNTSFGTDHGTANCSFVIGGQVKGGVYGGQPDLLDLQKDNLKHNIDFRSIYAKVIADWFGADPATVFDPAVINLVTQPDQHKIDFLTRSAVPTDSWSRYH